MRIQDELAVGQSGAAQNLVDLLIARAAHPSKAGARHKVDGRWVDVGWGEILSRVQALSAALVARGVQPGDRVAIFAATSLQWVVCDLAISAARGITVPIYASNTPDEVRFVLSDSGASLLFVDDDLKDGRQAGRLSRARSRLGDVPGVREVVCFDASSVQAGGKEVALSTLVAQGEAAHAASPGAFEQRVRAVHKDDACCFIYTSGTTGDPKGVVLTHGNWFHEAQAIASFGVIKGTDVVMLFLPLAHSFAQAVKSAWLSTDCKMAFAESVEKLVENLGEVGPTVLPAVPRVFEKVYNGVVSKATSQAGLKGRLARWAFAEFDTYAENRREGKAHQSVGFKLAKKLIFDGKIRPMLDERLGGNMRLFVSGAAPLSPKIGYFFDLLGFELLEGYGLTETSAGTSINPPGRGRIGSVGKPLPGVEVKIAADGEILMRGPHIMKEYYGNPVATAEVLDPDGWFHSGDVGELDRDGYLHITDRKKDLIVTAGGKNVAPQNLENTLKTFPLVSQAMVYGDKRPYLVALVCVSEEAGRKLLADQGIQVGSYAELVQRPEIRAAMQEVVDAVNAQQPPYSTLKSFALMDHDFTQESGELTPTLKVKRKVCTQKFGTVLEGLYRAERPGA